MDKTKISVLEKLMDFLTKDDAPEMSESAPEVGEIEIMTGEGEEMAEDELDEEMPFKKKLKGM